jgi:hypothetical protein
MTYFLGAQRDNEDSEDEGEDYGYAERAWAKVPYETIRHQSGERYIMCKTCDSAWYTVPNEEGAANCWSCSAEVRVAAWTKDWGAYTPVQVED